MRPILLVAALIIPFIAQAQDSTAAAREQTLFRRLGIAGAHFAVGATTTPYNGRTGSAMDMRLGITFERLREWTLVVGSAAIADTDTTAYVAPGSQRFHPRLASTSSTVELQRRWHSRAVIHPIAAMTVGRVTN